MSELAIGQVRRDPDPRYAEEGLPPRLVEIVVLGFDPVRFGARKGPRAGVRNVKTGRLSYVLESALVKWPTEGTP